MYDKQVADAEKEGAARIEDGSEYNNNNNGSRYEARVHSRSIENGRLRESVEKHVKNVNGKAVEQTVTTRFLADGTKEVHEVIKDEQGTREKTTRYDTEQQQ